MYVKTLEELPETFSKHICIWNLSSKTTVVEVNVVQMFAHRSWRKPQSFHCSR